jgi:cytoskeletal protein CcmA (bactofilin family)
MDPNNNKPETENNEPPKDAEPQAPADALSRTPDDLEKEEAEHATAEASAEQPAKKLSPIKKFFHKVNLYFLIFGLLVIIAGAVAVVYYFNSQKATPGSSLASQNLTQDSLKQLANTDASVGSSSQTLTIKGNAIIEGQTLTRGALSVAGNFQTAGSIQGTSLTVSGSANLGEAQINSLQVASNTAIQGTTTLRDLNVAGTTAFSGAVTASQITVTRLILTGNGLLQVPNHISFTGPAPSRSINAAVLGSGGSASVNGSDTSGTVNISTGGGTVAGCFVQINFAQNFNSQPRVIITPAGSGAGQTQYYVVRSPSSFSICTASPAPTNQTFAFDYFVSN